MRDAAKVAVRRTVGALLFAASVPAFAFTLGEADVRSYLGQPLDVRVPIYPAGGERIDESCFSLGGDLRSDSGYVTRGRISVEDAAQAPVLRIRTTTTIQEPVARLQIRTGCPGAGGPLFREYVLLLDPAPARPAEPPAAQVVTPPVVTRAAPQPVTPAAPAAIAAPVIDASLPSIEVLQGDSLYAIAYRRFGDDRRARARFIGQLRKANPEIAGFHPRETLPPGYRLTEPAGTTPAASREGATPQTRPAAPPRRPAASKPRTPTASVAPAARPAPSVTTGPSTTASTAASNFELRLSVGEMDMKRSEGLTDEQRLRLREKQLMLESDDQVATLLQLKNSVKQLESQLASMQQRMNQLSGAPAAAATGTPPTAATATPATPTPPTAASPAPAEPGAAQPPVPAVATAPKPPPAKTAPEPSRSSTWFQWWWLLPLLPLIALGYLWMKARRTRREALEWEAQLATTQMSQAAAPSSHGPRAAPLEEPTAILESGHARATVQDASENDLYTDRESSYGVSDAFSRTAGQAALSQTGGFSTTSHGQLSGDAKPSSDPELERRMNLLQRTGKAASLGDLDPKQVREYRLRYMEERFPEIANGAIRLDDPMSIIKGARLFFEDGATARAQELLLFAIEENPAEVRLWLAMFEIHRLEANASEFAHLAKRFHAIHSESEYWRKIQAIGHEMDAANPLFVETSGFNAGEGGMSSRGAAPSANFDPLTENWLHAPADFTPDVLALELRQILLAQHMLDESKLVADPLPVVKQLVDVPTLPVTSHG